MSSTGTPISVVPTASSTRSWTRCIAATTLLVGLSDFVQSYLLFSLPRHRPVVGVLQGPATGLLGRAAMTGGARTMDWIVLRFSRAHYYPLAEPYFWWLLAGHVPFVGFLLVWGVSRLAPEERIARG